MKAIPAILCLAACLATAAPAVSRDAGEVDRRQSGPGR